MEEEDLAEEELPEPPPAALSLSEYTTGAALAAAMAGADPFSAADVAVEALASYTARPLTPEMQAARDEAPPAARLDEMARLAQEAEGEADVVRARLNAALQRCGIAPRAEETLSDERNALLRQRALQAARESAAAAAAGLLPPLGVAQRSTEPLEDEPSPEVCCKLSHGPPAPALTPGGCALFVGGARQGGGVPRDCLRCGCCGCCHCKGGGRRRRRRQPAARDGPIGTAAHPGGRGGRAGG